MELAKNNSFKNEEDVTLSAFRRRNKIAILVFLFLFVSLALVIGALIIYLVHINDDSDESYQPQVNPALQAFCFVTKDTSSCVRTFTPIITTKSVTDPNQIFTLSLQTAAKELKNVVSLILLSTSGSINITVTNDAFKNCSTSWLPYAASQIRGTLAMVRANPSVETQSDEQRVEMMNQIVAAEENLDSCVDDLEKVLVESTAVSEVKRKVLRVKELVSSSGDFLLGYAEVLQMFWSDRGAHYKGFISLENAFIICTGGLELFFVFSLFWWLCRIR